MAKKNKNLEKEYSPRFELVIRLRDHMGNDTGKTKSFTTDYPDELERFWLQNNTASNREKYEQANTRRNKTRRVSNDSKEGNPES